jgi:MFS transporter, ACS family, allantoate permease
MGQIFGGLVAYGIDAGAKKHGSAIAPWKTVFMVNGASEIVFLLWLVLGAISRVSVSFRSCGA